MRFWLSLLASLPIEAAQTPSNGLILAQEPPPNRADENLSPLVFGGVIGILVILVVLSIWAYTRVYVITPNNEAFVRTGGIFFKKKMVILNGGCIVIPGFHELTRVPLREISIDVERTGKLAVRTQDYLRANMRVTFFVCINPTEESVLTSAARLSQQGRISPEHIKDALEKRADDAIRAAAKTKSLAEIDSDKLGFAQEVLNLIQPDLEKIGLTLNNIAISEIEESDTYDTNNFFDAQGVRLRTETIQRSIQQKQEVELSTRIALEQRTLDAEKQSLRILQEKESAQMEQQFQVEALKAQRDREIQEAKDRESAAARRTRILQDQAVEEEEIRKRIVLQQKQIEAEIALEEQNKQLKIAQALQKQAAETAEVSRQQVVDAARLQAQVQLAESERSARVAQQEAAVAIARKEQERLQAEAERAKAESGVTTATELEKAERQQRLAQILAQQEAEQRRIGEQNVVEIEAFRRQRQAEIARKAAELEAESIRTLALAERDKALAAAEGIRSQLLARNSSSQATLTADLIITIWPDLVEKLPEIARALAPQPGVLGEARIYASGEQDLQKLLLASSGLALVEGLLEEGKLGSLLGQVRRALQDPNSGSS